MTPAAGLTLVVIAGALVLMARDRLAPSAAVLGAVVLLLLLGVVTPEQAFAGFSNPAPITVAALYIVAGAITRAGTLQLVVRRMLGTGQSVRRGLARLLVPTAAASAVLNNTPIVAILAPQVSEWAHQRGHPPSRYLMPLSFAAILGGTITLVGTSTNIVVSGLLADAGLPPIGMFEMAPVGLPLALVGIGFMVLCAPLLLPPRLGARREFEAEVREFVFRMEVEPGGALDGASVEEGGLRHLAGVFLAEIERDGEVLAPARPATVLRGGDRLVFVGRADDVLDVQGTAGLRSTERDHTLDLERPGHTFFEAVVSSTSPVAGRTLKEVGFRGLYQGAVLAVHRSGARVHAKLGELRIRQGDTLLVLSDEEWGTRWRDRPDFLLIARRGGAPPPHGRMALVAAGVTGAMIVAVAAGALPMLQAALLAALLMVTGRVLTPAEARRAVDLDVIILIAAAFGLGAAMENSGLAALMASGIVAVGDVFGGIGILLAVVLVTMLVTEAITNNAAAVLLFPVAISTAAAAGYDPRPFAMAVAFAASSSFLTPIGYQTNTIVYGPGGYRFSDYLRLGVPLSLVELLVLGTLIPLVWAL